MEALTEELNEFVSENNKEQQMDLNEMSAFRRLLGWSILCVFLFIVSVGFLIFFVCVFFYDLATNRCGSLIATKPK